MTDIIIMILATIGAIFILSTAIAMLRKFDAYIRINVMTKTATLGLGLILTAAAVFFAETSVTARIIAIILFIFLTGPIGGQVLARAAYFSKTPKWKGTHIDDLEGKYNAEKGELKSRKSKTGVTVEKESRS